MALWKKAGQSLGLLLLLPSFVFATENALVFSEFEQQVWETIGVPNEMSYQQVIQRLHTLQDSSLAEPPAAQAFLLLQLCRLQPSDSLETYVQQAYRLEDSPEFAQGASARYRCELRLASDAQDFSKVVELNHLAYNSLNEHDLPILSMWVAYDYIEIALEAGLYDEALQAIEHSLKVAQANALTEWEGETLGQLALVQSAVGNYEQALETNARAQELVTLQRNTFEMMANRGYILTEARSPTKARDVYEQLLSETEGSNPQYYLIAGINLAGIYFQLEQYTEQLALTTELRKVVENFEDDYLQAYTDIAWAVALLVEGQPEQALETFTKARIWFEDNQILEPLVKSLTIWADILQARGHYEEAYLALLDSNNFQESINLAERESNALLNNALLTAEQKSKDLEQARQRQSRDQAVLEKKQLEQIFVLMMLVAVVVVLLVLLLAHRRLRKMNSLLSEKNQLLDYESTHDPLTKVYNRRYFNEFVVPKLLGEPNVLLLLLDIDHFKKINDTYGHSAGDEILQTITKRLGSKLKDNDCLIRWGGEEFLIYIEGLTNPGQCPDIVRRLLAAVQSSPVQLENIEVSITASIGFSLIHANSLNELEKHINKIDALLYEAKHTGRSRAMGTLTEGKKPVIIRLG